MTNDITSITMTNDITSITTRESKRSSGYLQLPEQLKSSFTTPVEIANRLFAQGKKDGLSNDLIRSDIESALAGVIKQRRLREILPLELKRKYTISDAYVDDGDDDNSAPRAELDESTSTEVRFYKHTIDPKLIFDGEQEWDAKQQAQVNARRRLTELGKHGESLNDIVNRILDELEECKKSKK